MNRKYLKRNLPNFSFNTDDKSFNVEVSVDNRGYMTFHFGDSLTARFDYNNSEQLVGMIKHAQEHLIHQALNEVYDRPTMMIPDNPEIIPMPEEGSDLDCSGAVDSINPDYVW